MIDFLRRLSDCKTPQIIRTIFSILADQSRSLVVFDYSSDFRFFQFLLKALGERFETTNYNCYYLDPHFLEFFTVLWQGLSSCPLFRFLLFSLHRPPARQHPLDCKFFFLFSFLFFSFLINGKMQLKASSFFFFYLIRGLVFKPGLWDLSVSQNNSKFPGSHTLWD